MWYYININWDHEYDMNIWDILSNATCLKMIYIPFYGRLMLFSDTGEHE